MNNHIAQSVTGEYVEVDGETYYRIANSHLMDDFFMTLVGASDHWMFISSNGSLTAGRQNADNALFPYATDDQLSAARAYSGSTTLIRLTAEQIWEPFAAHESNQYSYCRNIYKTPLGNKLIFEEFNETLQLTFRYRWAFSKSYGFVRSCHLINTSNADCSFELLDGIQNVLPYGVSSEFLMRFSNLGNAYKKNELVTDTGLALYVLSSIPTDKAEPSEALQATTVWQTGLQPTTQLISNEQCSLFRRGQNCETEVDVRGKSGAFLAIQSINLPAHASIKWHVVAEVSQDHSSVVALNHWLQTSVNHAAEIEADIQQSEEEFLKIVSSTDGRQCTANSRRTDRHQSNTVFNVMRGGLPLQDYDVSARDFLPHIQNFNKPVFRQHSNVLQKLPEQLRITDLLQQISSTQDLDFIRLTNEYLPLAFSRRHGDPTRPWNWFSIDLRSDDGSTSLNYQGNWRDIFQNWEALAVSFPEFSGAMICRFVNATTADGYNPYKVTKNGFDWEAPAPNDPWANIGYWGDHQIIYLLKLLECQYRLDPERLDTWLSSAEFVYANVPYRIKSFEDIQRDPQDTIIFDFELATQIDQRIQEIGADGKLLCNSSGEIHRVTFLEKLLTLSLAKLSNFVADGGIWLNTQRPEWNDANNALVGNGLSMVTTCYLYRWFQFLRVLLSRTETSDYQISGEVVAFFRRIKSVLESGTITSSLLSPKERSELTEALSSAGSEYRETIYESGFSGTHATLPKEDCLQLLDTASSHLESTIRKNRRDDGLYHAYNLMDWRESSLQVNTLYEMLEGQVAILSSGLLSANEAIDLLDALRNSRLYRSNQCSYLLYPDRRLPRFLDKNSVPADVVSNSLLLQKLLADGNESIVCKDSLGAVHFHGAFRNSNDLRKALENLPEQYRTLVPTDVDHLAVAFEDAFNHREFTGRSGTFFGYEGLGSIYWHMVSKLALAVCENFFAAVDAKANPATIDALKVHFREIRAGIGAEKSPMEYGAFSTDAYSHTPENAGAKQPGMTGQVKEDILSRFAELGVHIQDGCLCFRFDLFDTTELLSQQTQFRFYDLNGKLRTLTIPPEAFALTLCQVPIVCHSSDREQIAIHLTNGDVQMIDRLKLPVALSQQLFSRSGAIQVIHCHFPA